jgi:hypothetical protein
MTDLPWMCKVPGVSWIYIRYVRWKLTRWVWSRIKDEEQQVIEEVWAQPNTSCDEVLAWVDDQIAMTPRLPGLQWYKLFVCHCDEATYQRCIGGEDIELPEPIVEWVGPLSTWWYAGRDHIQVHLPAVHGGLALSLTNLAASIMRGSDDDDELIGTI